MPRPNEIPLHYVCTRSEARAIIDAAERFWVSNCGCREGVAKREGRDCTRSRVDVCLYTVRTDDASGTGLREASRKEAEALLGLAEEKRLVTRPFRGWEDRSVTEGICFCCDDCCGYFNGDDEVCDRGAFVESTDEGACDSCGACVDACYFGVRQMAGGTLSVTRERCYGCGLCADVCPLNCIDMRSRG